MTSNEKAVLASGLTLLLLRILVVPVRRSEEISHVFFFELTWYEGLQVAWDVTLVYALGIAALTTLFWVLVQPRE